MAAVITRAALYICCKPTLGGRWSLTFSVLGAIIIFQTYKTTVSNVIYIYILMQQIDSLATSNIFKQLKCGSIIIGYWCIHWIVHVWFHQKGTLVHISKCNKLASRRLMTNACAIEGVMWGDYIRSCSIQGIWKSHISDAYFPQNWSIRFEYSDTNDQSD